MLCSPHRSLLLVRHSIALHALAEKLGLYNMLEQRLALVTMGRQSLPKRVCLLAVLCTRPSGCAGLRSLMI